MPKYEGSIREASEEDRGPTSKRTTRSQGPAGQKQAPHTPAVMSGGATDADIRLNNDRDIRSMKKENDVWAEPIGTKPDYRPARSKIDWRTEWEAMESPKIEGSTNDKDYFRGRKPPQCSAIPLEEGHPGNQRKGKGKGKGKA